MSNWSILVRREFWEYRSLWVAPLWAAAFLLAGMVLALVGVQHVHVGDSDLNVVGGTLQGGEVDSHGDHRIAMAFAVASLRAQGELRILDVANVGTSFPDFPGAARAIGLNVEYCA